MMLTPGLELHHLGVEFCRKPSQFVGGLPVVDPELTAETLDRTWPDDISGLSWNRWAAGGDSDE